MKNFKVFFMCLLFLSLTSCTKLDINKAYNEYNNKNFTQTISILDGLPNKNQTSETFKLKGDSYFELQQYNDAYRCYEIAIELNDSLIIENLVELYFLNDETLKALKLIYKMEEAKLNISFENRKIEYVCLSRLKMVDQANAILETYFKDMSRVEIIKLKILSYNSNSKTVVSILSELYENSEFQYLEQLIDLCYSFETLDSNFLSLLNKIYFDNRVDSSLRIKSTFYLSYIFESINNNKQMLYYKNIFDKLSKDNNVIIKEINHL